MGGFRSLTTDVQRVVVVSPHLDDAVFSCGQWLGNAPRCTVLTVFAGFPEGRRRLTSWDERCGFAGAEEAMATRRDEDRHALELLSADPFWLDYLDSQYRAADDGESELDRAEIVRVLGQALRLSGEVLTSPFTFPATPHVLTWNNVTPVFVDIDPETMCIDPSRMESLVTGRTSGVLGVHVYGIPCDVQAIDTLARTYGLKVVYDGAHAFGTLVDGKPVSAFGDATMYSFHATKLFHTAEGGALAVSDGDLKKRIDLLKNFGIKNEHEVVMPGINGTVMPTPRARSTKAK